MPTKTNELTKKILEALFERGVFAWRQNTQGVFDRAKGTYRPAAKKGVSDILGLIPPHGRFLAIEVKTGRDKLSPEQIGFLTTVSAAGGIADVIKTETDLDNLLKSVLK